ncbi:MAG: hypothetical protein ACLU3G_07490 [Christensenellales bacterium]
MKKAILLILALAMLCTAAVACTDGGNVNDNRGGVVTDNPHGSDIGDDIKDAADDVGDAVKDGATMWATRQGRCGEHYTAGRKPRSAAGDRHPRNAGDHTMKSSVNDAVFLDFQCRMLYHQISLL